MKTNKRKNQIEVTGCITRTMDLNSSTAQFSELLSLVESDLSTEFGTTITDMMALYSAARIMMIKCEVGLREQTANGQSPPGFIHFAPGPGAAVVPTALSDIESRCVSNVSNGFSNVTTATQAVSTFVNPSKHCTLKITPADLAESVPGQWYAVLGNTGDSLDLGKFYYCFLEAGSNVTTKLWLRWTYVLEFKVLRDVAILRTLLVKSQTGPAVSQPADTRLNAIRKLLDAPGLAGDQLGFKS